MSPFEWFLLFWVGMALVQCVNLFSLVIRSYVQNIRIKKYTPRLVYVFATSSLIAVVFIVTFWPVALYKKRMSYFRFSDSRDVEIIDKFFR